LQRDFSQEDQMASIEEAILRVTDGNDRRSSMASLPKKSLKLKQKKQH